MKIRFKKKYLAMAIPLALASQAQALEFYNAGIEGSFNSQISLGSSWRVEDQDDFLKSDGNDEDGNSNFTNGDAFSQIFKGSHDLRLSYQNFGAFVRGKYWYDSALADNNVEYGHVPTASIGTGPTTPLEVNHDNNGRLDDSDFNDYAKFSGATLLDAFIYGEFELGEMPLDVRLGKQVVSWGESTFILGGINAINPVDVNAFTRPGAEIKEGLIPVNMAYANIGVSDDVSLEAFYQLEFQETVIPGCGTYFATNDFVSDGCNVITLPGAASLQRADDGIRHAKDDGQFGFALRYVSQALGDTEFGLYAMNIHSRAPVASAIYNNVDEAAIGAQAAADFTASLNLTAPPTAEQVAAITAVGQGAGAFAVVSSTKYFVEYPEDIQLYGLSFAANLGSMALSGEISHKIDAPIQINPTQSIAATLDPLGTASLAALDMVAPELDAAVAAAGEGGTTQGYRVFDISQAQVTAVQFIDQVMGANRITLIGEAGYTFIHGFKEGSGEIRYGRAGIFSLPGNTDGFVTESSYGYRTRVVAEYNDAFMGINLTPVLAFSHDVKGYAPQPGGAFVEGQQSLGFTLNADYQSTYNASLSYTQFMGGDYSVISDRDFASVSVGMQF